MPSWPLTLPAMPLLERFRETAPNTAARTDMDQGPAKVRQRTTAGVRILSVSYLLNAAQTETLDAFYYSTLAGGSLSFTFMHPRTGVSVVCRIKSPPEYTSTNGDHFNAALTLEVLP